MYRYHIKQLFKLNNYFTPRVLRFGIKQNDYPGARDCDANTMAIPLHNQMVKEDYEYIVNAFKHII